VKQIVPVQRKTGRGVDRPGKKAEGLGKTWQNTWIKALRIRCPERKRSSRRNAV